MLYLTNSPPQRENELQRLVIWPFLELNAFACIVDTILLPMFPQSFWSPPILPQTERTADFGESLDKRQLDRKTDKTFQMCKRHFSEEIAVRWLCFPRRASYVP